jgi:hypothetical protein
MSADNGICILITPKSLPADPRNITLEMVSGEGQLEYRVHVIQGVEDCFMRGANPWIANADLWIKEARNKWHGARVFSSIVEAVEEAQKQDGYYGTGLEYDIREYFIPRVF